VGKRSSSSRTGVALGGGKVERKKGAKVICPSKIRRGRRGKTWVWSAGG